MIEQIMEFINNHFISEYIDGTFRITGNVLEGAPDVRYVCISGSRYHDGVWEIVDGFLTGPNMENLPDEEFDGRVYILNPPKAFLQLCTEIEEYNKKVPIHSPTQERFGGYSYSRVLYNSTPGGLGWQAVFSARLAIYRKMFSDL